MREHNTRLKKVKEDSSASKKSLIEENRTLFKSFSAEVKKLEQMNQHNNTKIKNYQKKLITLKWDNKALAAVLHDEGSKSRLTIAQLFDDAERVIMEAEGVEQATDATVNSCKQEIYKEQQYYASQIT